jgi:ferredoxin
MAYRITDECIACGACLPECPNEAIGEGDIYVIDPAKCTECYGFFAEQQCASVCPVSACVADPAHKETKEHLLAKFKKLHPAKEPKETHGWKQI